MLLNSFKHCDYIIENSKARSLPFVYNNTKYALSESLSDSKVFPIMSSYPLLIIPFCLSIIKNNTICPKVIRVLSFFAFVCMSFILVNTPYMSK